MNLSNSQLCGVMLMATHLPLKFMMRLYILEKEFFPLPSGRSSKVFVSELSRLFAAYYPGSSLEGIALKAAMSLPILVLQKPFTKSKSSDHIQCIERRLKVWLSGSLTALLEKGHAIQHGLTCPHITKDSSIMFPFPFQS